MVTAGMNSPRLDDTIAEVTERIGGRSAAARGEYLERTRKRRLVEPARGKLALVLQLEGDWQGAEVIVHEYGHHNGMDEDELEELGY